MQLESSNLIPLTGIPKLILKVEQDLSYKACHAGLQFTVHWLTRNNIYNIRWSQLDEAIRYIQQMEQSHKHDVLLQQLRIRLYYRKSFWLLRKISLWILKICPWLWPSVIQNIDQNYNKSEPCMRMKDFYARCSKVSLMFAEERCVVNRWSVYQNNNVVSRRLYLR